jgi:hypothetical protein
MQQTQKPKFAPPKIGTQLSAALRQAIKAKPVKFPAKPAAKPAAQTTAAPEKKVSGSEAKFATAAAIASRIKLVNGAIMQEDTLKRLELIRELIHPFGVAKDQRTKEFLDMRRSAEACQNYLATVATGLRENDIDPGMLGDVVKNLRGYIQDVRDCSAAVEARKNKPETAEVDETLTEEKIKRFAQSRLHLSANVRRAAEKGANRPVFCRMPVLAIFDPAVRTTDLAEVGMPVEGYDGLYSVLMDQMVIGIPRDCADSDLLNKALAHVRKTDPSFALAHERPTGVPKHSMSFYWVADKALQAMMDDVKGKHVAVAKWSFPF